MEKVETDEEDRPKVELLHLHLFCVRLFSSGPQEEIKVLKTSVFVDPFQEAEEQVGEISCFLSCVPLTLHNYCVF